MNPARHVSRFRLLKNLGIAAIALCAAPAWSACTPPVVDGHPVHPFRVDDGVAREVGSRLEWQRCSVGQHFDDGKCRGAADKLDWNDAQKAASAAGHGWRLPTQSELSTLVLSYCSAPATDTAVFPETPATWFWTSATDGAQGAWFVDFEAAGGNGATLRTSTAAVRLVRQGE
jgi:hypothetical protein